MGSPYYLDIRIILSSASGQKWICEKWCSFQRKNYTEFSNIYELSLKIQKNGILWLFYDEMTKTKTQTHTRFGKCKSLAWYNPCTLSDTQWLFLWLEVRVNVQHRHHKNIYHQLNIFALHFTSARSSHRTQSWWTIFSILALWWRIQTHILCFSFC